MGIEGWSTNLSSWAALADKFPNLHFYMQIAEDAGQWKDVETAWGWKDMDWPIQAWNRYWSQPVDVRLLSVAEPPESHRSILVALELMRKKEN